MPAVMVNDEQPHQKPRRQYRQRHGQPIRHRQTKVHQVPERRIRNERVNDLPDAPSDRWLLVSGHYLFPGCIVWPSCICRRNWFIFIHHKKRSRFCGLAERRRAKLGTATWMRMYVLADATARFKDRNFRARRTRLFILATSMSLALWRKPMRGDAQGLRLAGRIVADNVAHSSG